MSTFAQTADGDLALSATKNLTIVRGADELAVRARNRTFTVRGEWYQNLVAGIPYFELVWVKDPNVGVIKNVFQQAYSTLPGLAELSKLDTVFRSADRSLSVDIELKALDGSIVTGQGGLFIVENA